MVQLSDHWFIRVLMFMSKSGSLHMLKTFYVVVFVLNIIAWPIVAIATDSWVVSVLAAVACLLGVVSIPISYKEVNKKISQKKQL